MNPIQWKPELVKVEDLKENPKNPKIINERGKSRLKKSLAKFGLAGTIICNTDLTIIDGHSRKKELIEAGIEEVWISKPDRKLSSKDYKEFNAIIDLAKAGDSDLKLIEQEFTEIFFEEWDIEKNIGGKKVEFIAKNKGNDSKTEYIIEIRCENEAEQTKIFHELKQQGYKCNVATI